MQEYGEENQSVRGVIIAFEDDVNIRRALSVTQSIDFYTYKVHFKLEKKVGTSLKVPLSPKASTPS
jgi:restriction system protein